MTRGQVGSLRLYLYDFCIRDFTPVYPGALQNPAPHRFSELPCDAAPILTNHVRVDRVRDRRAGGMA
jgi:hypothetical protein